LNPFCLHFARSVKVCQRVCWSLEWEHRSDLEVMGIYCVTANLHIQLASIEGKSNCSIIPSTLGAEFITAAGTDLQSLEEVA
jgi:hypothetical protein